MLDFPEPIKCESVRSKSTRFVFDGPFPEGREAALGIFLVRAHDVDEACAIADESPYAVLGGATEVRMLSAFSKP